MDQKGHITDQKGLKMYEKRQKMFNTVSICFLKSENVDGWLNPALRQIFNLPGIGFCSFLGRSG